MAVLLRLEDRSPDRRAVRAGEAPKRCSADIVILPCIRRERTGEGAVAQDAPPAQISVR